MSREASPTPSRWALAGPLAILCYGLVLVGVSILTIVPRLSAVPYWDQWGFLIAAAEYPRALTTLGYLFAPHNEHIIATSKPIYLLDLLVFGGRNLASVTAIYVFATALALAFAALASHRLDFSRAERLALAAITAACTTALAQWENLIWGFQTQFHLVLLGGLTSSVLTYIYARGGRWALPSLAGLALALPFTVFTLGSGVLVAIPVFFIVLAQRLDWRRALPPLILAVLFVGLFFWLVRLPPSPGDLSLRTPLNLVVFFFAMLGGPFSPEIPLAVNFGLLACAAILLALAGILYVWLKRRPIDGPSLVLVAFMTFLVATAAATSYGRVTLTLVSAAATPPRYATPMLMLWLTLGALAMRTIALRLWSPVAIRVCAMLSLVAAAAFATWLDVRPDTRPEINNRYLALEQVGYAMASGVDADAILATVFPSPNQIRNAVDFLRSRRLSVFSPNAPSTRIDNSIMTRDAAAWPACANGSIDGTQRVSPTGALLAGWVAGPNRRPPQRLYAIDPAGKLLGFTRPLVGRPDVAAVLGTRRPFFGFSLPLNLAGRAGEPRQRFNIVAVFDSAFIAPCRIWFDSEVPAVSRAVLGRLAMLPLAATTAWTGEAAPNGLPAVVAPRAPYEGATVGGTFLREGLSTGTMSFTLSPEAHRCGNVILPVFRGPDPAGLEVAIGYPDGTVERPALAAIAEQTWVLLEIPGARICQGGGAAALTLTISDTGAAPGSWIVAAAPARRR